MKTDSKQMCFLALSLGLCSGVAFAHEIPVHQNITENAADSALSLSTAYAGFLNSISVDLPISDARKYLSEGSAREDDIGKDEGGLRSLNHFYDPLTGLGLSNIPPDDRPTSGTLGIDSFTWASVLNSVGINLPINPHPMNVWAWQNARDYEFLGLTAPSRTARQDALLNMFRALGQVVHLLEDASQPQHTRNEQYLKGTL